MIYDTLENIIKLSNVMPGLAPMRDFLARAAVSTYEDMTEYKGLDLRLNDYFTKPEDEIPFEAHKKLWDMQIVFEGEEKLTALPLNELQEQVPYDEARDIAFYNGTACGTDVILKRGYAAILAPWDGHRPGAETERGSSHIKKIVVKFAL